MTQQKPPLEKGCYSALLVVGVMLLSLSGLCTGFFTFMVTGQRDLIRVLQVALMYGGPFLAIGGLMVWQGLLGHKQHRQAASPKDASGDTID